MASSILPLVNGETTSSLLSGGIVPTGTTSAIAGTGTALYVIDGKKGEREFKPKKVSTTLASSTSSTIASTAINNHNNLEYQRYLNQLQQANVVRNTQEMMAAESPEYLDALLAMIDTREQELASLEQQEEKVHVKHL